VAAHYEWVHARDNTDGPFSYPERPGDLAGEWAPSAGLATHHTTVMATFALRGGVSLNVSDTWHSGTPYSITTGRDPSGNLLFVDRGGLPRNAGRLAGVHDLSLYAFRRLAVPDGLVPGRTRVHVSIGAQAQNMLDNESFTTIGAVSGSSGFGRPLSALPGRTLRLFLSLD
jgi:hypothetical protein